MARWPVLWRSTTAHFVLLAFALQFIVMTGAVLFVQQMSAHAVENEQQMMVQELRDDLVSEWMHDGDQGLRSRIAARTAPAHGGGAVILYADADGRPLAGNLAAWPPVLTPGTQWRSMDLFRIGSDHPEHMSITTVRLSGGERLLVGHVTEPVKRLSEAVEEALMISLAGSLLLAFLAALILGKLLSRRVARIAGTVHAVTDGALNTRVKTRASGDAFDDLGHSINQMLDRIEMLVTQLRVMTDGLAHDMRSPVTRMQSVIERASLDVADPAAQTALERVGAEADTLLRMVSTALQISRAEAGLGREYFKPVAVRDMLDDLVEIYGPVAEEQGMVVESEGADDVVIALHRELISQALGNLIENALKYADGGHRIHISSRIEGDRLCLAVSDDGAGIPAERMDEALQRFVRLDPARTLPGSGLGLTLVDAIARLHGGEIQLKDAKPGLRVEIRIATGHRCGPLPPV